MTEMQLSQECWVNHIEHADDTLLVDVDLNAVDAFVLAVGRAGNEYGLKFNWSKLEALAVNNECALHLPDNTLVPVRCSIKY